VYWRAPWSEVAAVDGLPVQRVRLEGHSAHAWGIGSKKPVRLIAKIFPY